MKKTEKCSRCDGRGKNLGKSPCIVCCGTGELEFHISREGDYTVDILSLDVLADAYHSIEKCGDRVSVLSVNFLDWRLFKNRFSGSAYPDLDNGLWGAVVVTDLSNLGVIVVQGGDQKVNVYFASI